MFESFKAYFQAKTNITEEQFDSIATNLQYKKSKKEPSFSIKAIFVIIRFLFQKDYYVPTP